MKEIKIEDLKVGMKVNLKPFVECKNMDRWDSNLHLCDKFDNIQTIFEVNTSYDWFYIDRDDKPSYPYFVDWIKEIVDNTKEKKKKPNDFIFVEDHIIRKDFINGVSNKNNGCVIYMADEGQLVLSDTSSKDVLRLLSE